MGAKEGMTDEQLKHWLQVNFPKAKGTGEMRERDIRHDTVKRVISYVTKNACEPETIGRRIVVLDWYFQDEDSIQPLKQKDLAQRLGVTEGRCSQMLSAAEDALAEILKEKS